MSKTWRLGMEVFFRPDNRVSHRSIFQGTDGGSFSHTRCGGRLPGIWTRSIAPPIRPGSYSNTYELFFPLIFKIVFETIEDFWSVAVLMLIQTIVNMVLKFRSTNGLVTKLWYFPYPRFVLWVKDYHFGFKNVGISNHNSRFILKSDKN